MSVKPYQVGNSLKAGFGPKDGRLVYPEFWQPAPLGLWYPLLSQGSTRLKDFSTYRHDGIWQAAAVNPWGTNPDGTVATMAAGASNWFNCGNAAACLNRSPYTVALRAKPTASGQRAVVSRQQTGQAYREYLVMYNTSSWLFQRYDATGGTNVSWTATAANTSIVATYDGTNMRLYGNGALVGGPTSSTKSPSATTLLEIGRSENGTYTYAGDISYVGVWPYAFSLRMVKLLHADPWAPLRTSPRIFGAAVAAGAYSLTGSPGAFTLTGLAAGMTVQRALTGSPGAFTLSGQAAGMTAQRALTAVPGAFTVSGQPADMTAGEILAGSPGAFTLTGQAAGMAVGRLLAAAPGAMTLTGLTAGMTAQRTMTGSPGAFTITGQAAGMTPSSAAATSPIQYYLAT
jgi:hypothetical protein